MTIAGIHAQNPQTVAWIADDLNYPKDAPVWIASGDLERV